MFFSESPRLLCACSHESHLVLRETLLPRRLPPSIPSRRLNFSNSRLADCSFSRYSSVSAFSSSFSSRSFSISTVAWSSSFFFLSRFFLALRAFSRFRSAIGSLRGSHSYSFFFSFLERNVVLLALVCDG